MNKGISAAESQVLKIFRHTRQGSFATRDRYRDSCLVFARFINNQFKLQNLNNISDKHLVSFSQQRQSEGIAPKTIKNDLAAIRYLHDQLPKPRYKLSTNEQLRDKYGLILDKTPAVKGNRAWTDEEFDLMLSLAILTGHRDEADILMLIKHMGFRIAEVTLATRSQVEAALRTGCYQIKGEAKNGKWREVPLHPIARDIFTSRLKTLGRGERLFIKPGGKAHEVLNRLEKFLEYYRDKAETEDGKIKRTWTKYGITKTERLTYHGLRYNYVQDRINQELNNGRSIDQAYGIVTKEVGHNRHEVINVYLGGCFDEDKK